MSVKERLKEYLKSQKISISSFEKQLNASNGYVNSISRSIGIDKLVIISEKFSNLNLEWLLVERGEMLRDSNTNAIQQKDIQKFHEEIEDKIRLLDIQEELILLLRKEIHRLEKENDPSGKPDSA